MKRNGKQARVKTDDWRGIRDEESAADSGGCEVLAFLFHDGATARVSEGSVKRDTYGRSSYS